MNDQIEETHVDKPTKEEMAELQEMSTGYLRCMLKCAEDEDYCKKFLKDPRMYLNKDAGLRIPEGVKVVMDDTVYWPTTYIKTEQGEIAIVEKNYHVDVVEKYSDDKHVIGSVREGKHIDFKKPVDVEVDVNESLKDSTVVIRFPFFNVRAQDFMEIKFTDESEIVMCSC